MRSYCLDMAYSIITPSPELGPLLAHPLIPGVVQSTYISARISNLHPSETQLPGRNQNASKPSNAVTVLKCKREGIQLMLGSVRQGKLIRHPRGAKGGPLDKLVIVRWSALIFHLKNPFVVKVDPAANLSTGFLPHSHAEAQIHDEQLPFCDVVVGKRCVAGR